MPKARPERSCIACRRAADKGDLLRFVLSPEGTVLPDLQQKLPGRGVYTCPTRDCLAAAARKRLFSRGFKTEVKAGDPEALVREVSDKLRERVAGYLSLAAKAGKVVSGSDQVQEQLKKGGGGLLFLATDISAEIGAKFRGVAGHRGVDCMALFDKERLGQLIGKDLRSVVALQDSGFVGAIRVAMEKYRNFFEEERE